MKLWNKTLLKMNSNLREAIEILDKAALRIALIVDDTGCLQGTLTDGDVRRALLKQLSLDIPVTQVMNSSPKVAQKDWTESRMLTIMKQYEVLQLPLIDNNGKLVGLVNQHDLLNKNCYDNPVFIMAGGFGTRLRPLTNTCPKPMLKIGDKPILEHILLSFIKSGFYRFYISTHYMPEVIRNYFGNGEKWGVSIKYIHEETPLGTGGALGLLPHNEIDLPLFVMNGDLLTSLNIESFLEFHLNQNNTATMCVRKYEHQVPYGVITSEGTEIKSMIEKPIYKFFVNAGIYLLNPELVKTVKQGTCIDMPKLLEQQINANQSVSMFPVHEYWLDIGRMTQYEQANREYGEVFDV